MHQEFLGRFPSRTVRTYVDIFILAAKKHRTVYWGRKPETLGLIRWRH